MWPASATCTRSSSQTCALQSASPRLCARAPCQLLFFPLFKNSTSSFSGSSRIPQAHRQLMHRFVFQEFNDAQRPHRLVVRTSRRGRDNPGSTPGVVRAMHLLCHSLLAVEFRQTAFIRNSASHLLHGAPACGQLLPRAPNRIPKLARFSLHLRGFLHELLVSFFSLLSSSIPQAPCQFRQQFHKLLVRICTFFFFKNSMMLSDHIV